MKTLKYFSVLLTLLLANDSLQSRDFFIPVEVPEYRILYDWIERLEIEGGSYRLLNRVAPLSDRDIFSEHQIFGGSKPGRYRLKSFSIVTEEFNSVRYSRAHGFESIRAGFMAVPAKNLSLYAGFLLDEHLVDNPEYSGKKWRGLAGEIETAMFVYRKGNFDLIGGRFGSSWGPIRRSLILSETARPMDAMQLRFNWGKFAFTYQLGTLSRLRSAYEDRDGYENRYFSGHRLDFSASNNLYIGLFETVIYGGRGRSPELAYLNPLMFFHSFQLNENLDDNTFLGIDISYYLQNRCKFYGQFLVDDFQIDSRTRSDNEPNEIGLLLGIHSLNIFRQFDLKAEYLRITNRTYNQTLERNRYVSRGELIGHEFGPDGERYSLTLNRWFRNTNKAFLNISYQRQGEGRYDDDWIEPWLDVDDYTEPFPTGIVEENLSISLGFIGYPRKCVYIDTEFGLRFVNNYGHTPGDDRTIPFLAVRFSLLLATGFNVR